MDHWNWRYSNKATTLISKMTISVRIAMHVTPELTLLFCKQIDTCVEFLWLCKVIYKLTYDRSFIFNYTVSTKKSTLMTTAKIWLESHFITFYFIVFKYLAQCVTKWIFIHNLFLILLFLLALSAHRFLPL